MCLQVLKSDNMNHFVNLSQQYGPGIAQQAMAAVSFTHLHKALSCGTRSLCEG
jgi:hypothetical protein